MTARSAVKAVALLLTATAFAITFAACKEKTEPKKESYMQITAKQAKELMDTRDDYTLLDVRSEAEYAGGHIPGAICIPDNEINTRAETELPDKTQLILVYCRSGWRSQNAAAALAAMGYENVKDFGGILDWPYDTETE